MSDTWRGDVLEPPLFTAELPGVGGVLRQQLEDFEVAEIPAYPPDGGSGHVFVLLKKRGVATHEAIELVAKACGTAPREVGSAGRKDRDAVTEQWISLPAEATDGLAAFEHPGIELGSPQPHSHKLRMGHLKGNAFRITIRELAVPPGVAKERIAAKLEALQRCTGAPNTYGPQRFGRAGVSLDRGLDALRRGKGGARGNMIVAAGQAGLFNLYALERRRRELWGTVLEGDVLKKRETGGLFTCTEPSVDTARLRAGELAVTGPIFGSKMRAPPPGTPSAQLEADVLGTAGVPASALPALGKKARGTRRPLSIPLALQVEAVEGGIRVDFALPPGSYATTVCSELMGPA